MERICVRYTDLRTDATHNLKLNVKRNLESSGVCNAAAACLSFFWLLQLYLSLTCLLHKMLWSETFSSLNIIKEPPSKTELLFFNHLRKLKIHSSCYMTTIWLLSKCLNNSQLLTKLRSFLNQLKWFTYKPHSERWLGKNLNLLEQIIRFLPGMIF